MKEYILEFSLQDQGLIDAFLKKYSLGLHQPIAISLLIERWERLINEIEAGYNLPIYEYQNDLGYRTIIEKVKNVLSSSGKQQIEDIIFPLDKRFREFTTFSLELSSENVTQEYWWKSHIPLKNNSLLRD